MRLAAMLVGLAATLVARLVAGLVTARPGVALLLQGDLCPDENDSPRPPCAETRVLLDGCCQRL